LTSRRSAERLAISCKRSYIAAKTRLNRRLRLSFAIRAHPVSALVSSRSNITGSSREIAALPSRLAQDNAPRPPEADKIDRSDLSDQSDSAGGGRPYRAVSLAGSRALVGQRRSLGHRRPDQGLRARRRLWAAVHRAGSLSLPPERPPRGEQATDQRSAGVRDHRGKVVSNG
jgi:hypothetical protein